eukprot:PhM_4_TR16592/c0_g1_i1/m.2627
MGKLIVTVLGCRDLEDKDTFGKSDPYVVLHCGGKKFKTKVIKNNLNPNFNEQFTFFVADPNTEQVKFEVYDSDTFSDDLIGWYTLSLAGLERGKKSEGWYLLQKPAKKGTLGVSLLAEDFGHLPQQQPATAGGYPQQQQQPHTPPQGFPQHPPQGFPQQPPQGFPQQPPPGFPQQQQGYAQQPPPAFPGYPQQQYPQQGGYPQAPQGFPQQPQQYAGYPQQQGYPQQYPPQQQYPSQQQSGYPTPPPAFPPPSQYPQQPQGGYPGYPPAPGQQGYVNPFGGVGGVQYY